MDPWPETEPGVLVLPSGRRIRGRGLRRPLPDDSAAPAFGLYLLGRPPCPVPWATRWVCWPDFRLPTAPGDLRDALHELWQRAESERVEVACAGGTGRTGTALACLAVLDGLPPARAVAFVRSHYRRHAVETRGQVRFVARFSA